MAGVSQIALFVFMALLLAAAFSDLLTMRIPNALPVALALLFLPVALAVGLDAAFVAQHYAAGVGVLALCFALFAMNWIGGGDAKLAAAIAVWTGPFMPLLEWAILATILGGVLTVLILLVRRMPLPVALAGQAWIARLHDTKTGVPYGIALSGAALAMAPSLAIFLR